MNSGGNAEKKTESRNERFRRLAENRTNAIMDKIRILGHLSDRNRYEFTKQEIDIIFRAIEQELKRTKERFLETDRGNKFRFK